MQRNLGTVPQKCPTELTADDLVVSVHGCGALTDRVIDLTIQARDRLAVLPCCHDLESGDCGGLRGWLDGPLAMDVTRPRGFRRRATGL